MEQNALPVAIPKHSDFGQHYPNLFAGGADLSLNKEEEQSRRNEKSFLTVIQNRLGVQGYHKVLAQLNDEIQEGIEDVQPRTELMFSWTRAFPVDEVEAVVLGREPAPSYFRNEYMGGGERVEHELQASGFAFHPLDEENVSSSVEGVIKSIERFFNLNPNDPTDFSLENWIYEEKVLLLNWFTSVTCFVGSGGRRFIEPHEWWEPVTLAILEYIMTSNQKAVVIHALDDERSNELQRHLAANGSSVNFGGRIVRVRHPAFETYPNNEGQQTQYPEIAQGLERCNNIKRSLGERPINWLNLTRFL